MIKKIILVTLTILWMIIIFAFSNQKAKVSTGYSDSFINKTIVNIYKIFNSNPTEEEQNDIIETFTLPIRKLAHITEYFILGILVFLTLKEFNCRNIYIIILICFLYAVSDEVHQLFIPGRSGSFIDVLIDSFGSTLSVLLLKCKIKF